MTSSGVPWEWDLVVPADGGELLAELRRHGVEPGQRVHLRAVPDTRPAGWRQAVDSEDFTAPLVTYGAAKRPPFRSPAGRLASQLPDVTEDDFAAASRLAAEDAEASGTLAE